MKATLFVIENDTDHAHAKALIEKLIGSKDPADQARMTAQARLIEAYELTRWPRRTPSLPELLTYLMDQHGLSRADLPAKRLNGQARSCIYHCGDRTKTVTN